MRTPDGSPHPTLLELQQLASQPEREQRLRDLLPTLPLGGMEGAEWLEVVHCCRTVMRWSDAAGAEVHLARTAALKVLHRMGVLLTFPQTRRHLESVGWQTVEGAIAEALPDISAIALDWGRPGQEERISAIQLLATLKSRPQEAAAALREVLRGWPAEPGAGVSHHSDEFWGGKAITPLASLLPRLPEEEQMEAGRAILDSIVNLSGSELDALSRVAALYGLPEFAGLMLRELRNRRVDYRVVLVHLPAEQVSQLLEALFGEDLGFAGRYLIEEKEEVIHILRVRADAGALPWSEIATRLLASERAETRLAAIQHLPLLLGEQTAPVVEAPAGGAVFQEKTSRAFRPPGAAGGR